MPSRKAIEILTKYHVNKRNGKRLQVRLKYHNGLPKLAGVFLDDIDPDIMLRVEGRNDKIGSMSTPALEEKYTDVMCKDNTVILYDGDDMVCNLYQLQWARSLFASVKLTDLHPLPLRPFQDGCSLVTDILPLVLTWLPFEDLVKVQVVCRRFQHVIRYS